MTDYQCGPTYRLGVAGRCPACAAELSAATNIDSQDPPGQGDYTICIECGQVLRFVPGVAAELAAAGREWRPALAVVAVGDEELRALMYADPTLMARLTVVRWAVDQMRVGRRAQRN